jgi:HEAT repeat protein
LLARKNAQAASPYLRVAARDDAKDVRAAAAACLDDLVAGDPRGGVKVATELAAANEAAVRAAAAVSLGRLAVRAPDTALGTLFKLLGDPEAAVRDAAARGLSAFGESGAAGPGFGESQRGAEAERALNAALIQGEVAGRRLVVTAAAKNRLAGVLRQATTDADPSVRLQAVEAAGALAPPALDVVREAVDDRSSVVRAAATRILAAASGGGAKEVLPIYEAALRGGDHAARQAAIAGLGELSGTGDAAARLLGEALQQRSESLRSAAAEALGRLAERAPAVALPILERALYDPSYDVAQAAAPGIAAAWSRGKSSEALATTLEQSEADSARRFVALEALVMQAERPHNPSGPAAVASLKRVAEHGPPLARLAAQLGRACLGAPSAHIHTFIERLLGG